MGHFPAFARLAICHPRADYECQEVLERTRRMKQNMTRFVVVMVLLLAATIFLQARKRPESTPPSDKLASFPLSMNGWTGRDIPIDQETLNVLKAGDTLERVYTNEAK